MIPDRFRRLQDVAGPVSRETFEYILDFEREFLRWAPRINLAGPSTLADVWERHILDSAQLLSMSPGTSRWLDLGSGGGFPGAVLAILLRDRPGAHIDLVESNKKKASFLRTVLAKYEAPGMVHACRIEDLRGIDPLAVTARALAPLPLLLSMASGWLTAGARGLFHKGRGYRTEVEESRDAWHFDLVEHASRVACESVILEISALRKL